jgi:catechol 2,3-dioxygenase-like lactoylglutathione lyase family enzyme
LALSISLDCNDLERQEAFWSAALGYRVVERAPLHTMLGPPADRDGPLLGLNLVPEAKSVKNRMHLDWDVDDIEVEAARLERLGAVRHGRGALETSEWITMQDPEGNEFCVERMTR